MNILQIVTYISPDGAYGGPVRVAINQAKALTEQGHNVVLAASAGGFDGSPPSVFDGFPVTLFPLRYLVPGTGFAGMSSPAMLLWLRAAIRGADVIHVHLARDLVTLPAAALAMIMGKPVIVQTHGMIDPTSKLLAKPLDLILTRPVLKQAKALLFLTERERADLVDVAGSRLKLRSMPNGVDLRDVKTKALAKNESLDEKPEVLFLARLHERKRPLKFVESAIRLVQRGIEASFHLVGPDEGEGQAVQKAIEAAQVRTSVIYEGSVAPHKTQIRLAQCEIYVLPSIDEPFPMSAIEAMAVGKPIIITDSCGLASYVISAGAGIVVDDTLETLTQAIEHLLHNMDESRAMGSRGRQLVENEFDIKAVAARLARIYDEVG